MRLMHVEPSSTATRKKTKPSKEILQRLILTEDHANNEQEAEVLFVSCRYDDLLVRHCLHTNSAPFLAEDRRRKIFFQANLSVRYKRQWNLSK